MPAVSMTVNGQAVGREVEGRTMLVDFLREQLGLTGTHVGCDTTQCGACVVHVNGLAMKSCTMLALQCEGAVVTTIEGLAPRGTPLHPRVNSESGTVSPYWLPRSARRAERSRAAAPGTSPRP